MKNTKFQTIISDLLMIGFTQSSIGARIGLSQPSVRSILKGETKDPSHSVGESLIDLHHEYFDEICRAKKGAA